VGKLLVGADDVAGDTGGDADLALADVAAAGRAAAGRPLVDHAVAVVVDVVAALGRLGRRYLAQVLAAEDGVGDVGVGRLAAELAVVVALALDADGGGVQGDADVVAAAAVSHVVGEVEVLVDLVVAVVVEPVAGLVAAGGGDAGVFAAGLVVEVVEAGQTGERALARRARARAVELVARLVAAAAVPRVVLLVEAVVDDGVAVVVLVVASLGDRRATGDEAVRRRGVRRRRTRVAADRAVATAGACVDAPGGSTVVRRRGAEVIWLDAAARCQTQQGRPG
jgi:hypothetical protein